MPVLVHEHDATKGPAGKALEAFITLPIIRIVWEPSQEQFHSHGPLSDAAAEMTCTQMQSGGMI